MPENLYIFSHHLAAQNVPKFRHQPPPLTPTIFSGIAARLILAIEDLKCMHFSQMLPVRSKFVINLLSKILPTNIQSGQEKLVVKLAHQVRIMQSFMRIVIK